MCEQISSADFEESKWYVLFVRSNQEKRVAHFLNGRRVEHFLPCYLSVRQWKDRRVKLEMPLFPGYVFVRLPFRERTKVLTIPQVVSLVGTKSSPSVISDSEIAGIRTGIEHGQAEPHQYLEAGQRVVITDGVMSGMEGILLSVRNRTRVVLSLHSIAQAFVVEVSASWVRPLNVQNVPANRPALPRSTPLRGCVCSTEVPLAATPQRMIEAN